MIVRYRIKKIGKAENPVLTVYSTCCEDNLAGVFSGLLKPKLNPFHLRYEIRFNGHKINFCPYCGADISFIKD